MTQLIPQKTYLCAPAWNRVKSQARLCEYHHERGTALIMSLVILLILTILGVTAMSTASLEEKMSGNTQEGVRGFQVAESGLVTAFMDSTQFAANSTPVTTTLPKINGRVAQVTTTYIQQDGDREPPRGFGFGASQKAFYFQQQSQVNTQVDSANIGLNTTVTRGVVQVK